MKQTKKTSTKTHSTTTSQATHSQYHERQNWSHRIDFLKTVMCCILGLGDVSLFPLLAYRSGAGSFFIPYFFCMLSIGVPTMFIEISLGQFSSTGPLTCWEFCPLISGCGILMILLLTTLSVYYNVLIAWAIYFFFNSMTSETPWITCGNWSSIYCIDNIKFGSKIECDLAGDILNNGLCQINNSKQIWIWNDRLARKSGVHLSYPATEFFDVNLRNRKISPMTTVSPKVILSLILTSFMIWICVIKGVIVSVKIAFGLTVLAYLILLTFVIRGLTLKGAGDGLIYLAAPNFKNTLTFKMWVEASNHVCFSLSVAYGSLIALGSYNKFRYDMIRDIFILPVIDAVTGILSCIAIFTHLGFLADLLKVEMGGLAMAGPLGTFEIFPFVLSKLSYTPIWSAAFFLMILIIGINSQRLMAEVVIISVVDFLPSLKERKFITISALCIVQLLLGLPLTSREGLRLLNVLTLASGGMTIMVIVFLENVAIGWIYGADRFIKDIEVMLRGRYCMCFTFGRVCQMWWKMSWRYLGPFSSMSFLIFAVFSERDLTDDVTSTDVIVWTVMFVSIATVIGVGIYEMLTLKGTMKERFFASLSPTQNWGPLLVENRQIVKRYIPDLVVFLEQDDLFGTEILNPSVLTEYEDKDKAIIRQGTSINQNDETFHKKPTDSSV